MRSVRGFAALLTACLILYVPGLASIPPVDRNEAHFAQATRQMLESAGDSIRIRFQEEARNKKPIGIHWLQAAAVALSKPPGSSAVWPYRLPSVLAAAFVLPTAGVTVPGLNLLWLSRAAATLVARHLSRPSEAVLSVGDSEPGLVFLLDTATRLAAAAPGDRQLAGAGMALVSDREDAAFRKSLATRGSNFSAVDRVTGLDYSAGEGREILILYDWEPP